MSDINTLVEAARQVAFTLEDRAEQRRSFAYGSAHIENERITRETVIRAEQQLIKELRAERRE